MVLGLVYMLVNSKSSFLTYNLQSKKHAKFVLDLIQDLKPVKKRFRNNYLYMLIFKKEMLLWDGVTVWLKFADQ